MERENIVGLIQKLLALSHSPNENEAALAMSKAQELLLKYNLDMSTIQTPTQEDSQETGLINEIVDFSDFEKWQSMLITAVARGNFCKTINAYNEIHILGRKSNVRAVVAMYNWLEPQIIRLIKLSGYKRGDKTSFAYGIINTVSQKLNESKEDYQVKNPMSRALIVNVQKEVDVWFKSQYPYTTSSRVTLHGSAYQDGKQAGHKVSVYNSSRQVAGGRLLLS